MDEFVPLSVLALDLPAPSTGWEAGLAARGIPVRLDDLGRPSITREAARRLFAEARESAARARESAARNDQMLELQRQTIPVGLSAVAIGFDPNPARAVVLANLEAERDSRPRRVAPWEDVLSGEGSVYRRLPPDSDSG